MEDEIRARVMRAIDDRVFPGCVVGIVRRTGEREVIPFGCFTYEAGSRSVRDDTIYDVASLTKVIPTSSLALMLIKEGRLSLVDKLVRYVPEFRNSYRDTVEIRHLLDYTLCYDSARLSTFRDKAPQQLVEYILTREFSHAPGTVQQPSNSAPFLLGLVVEKILGENLDSAAQRYFFEPLTMKRTTFSPGDFPKDEIVPTEVVEGRGLVHGEVHDESAYVLRVKGGLTAGQAGLFSTAPDLLNFLEMLITDGVGRGLSNGLGWDAREPLFMGDFAGIHAFGKTGFTGTLAVFDAERGVAFVILSNRIHPYRPTDPALINAVRHDVADIIWRSTV